MWDTLLGYLFTLLLGLASLALVGWLVVSGQVTQSLDTLFLAHVAGLFVVMCFGYLAMRIASLLGDGGKKKR